MHPRSLASAAFGGLLYGALLFGGILSWEHVLYNHLSSPVDGLITLALFALLYGLWAGLFFAGAWVVTCGARGLRRFSRGTGAVASPAESEAWKPGFYLFNLTFWEVFFLYGLTYDQVPFGPPVDRWGMLAVLVGLALLVGAGAWIAARLQLAAVRWLRARGGLRAAVSVFAAVLVAGHLASGALIGPRPGGTVPPVRVGSTAPQPPPVLRTDTGLKVVVVGFDGADWRVLRPMMERGELPHFSSAVSDGVSADLASLPDSNSAVIWASIYSGMVPERHGVLDFYRIALPGMSSPGLFPIHRTFFKELADLVSPLGLTRQIPVDRFSLHDAPFWEIADRFGISIGVVDGYFYSFPALRPRLPESYFFTYGLNELAPHPPQRIDLFVQPKELFRSLRDRLGAEDFAWQSAVLASRLAVGAQPTLINFYTHQPDSVQHWTWKWYEPAKFFGVGASELAAKGDLIPRQQRDFDTFLGRLEKATGPETVILVASDHGHSPTIVHSHYSQHRHGPPGILTLRGGPVRKGVKLRAASVYDIYPTVLYLLGLPVPRDAAGRVLLDALEPAFVQAHPVRTIPSYRPYGPSPGLPGAARDGALNEMEIEKLRSLGYLL